MLPRLYPFEWTERRDSRLLLFAFERTIREEEWVGIVASFPGSDKPTIEEAKARYAHLIALSVATRAAWGLSE
ncbi:hypothetical protein LTR36_006073 [Oleoguttula mirabilis]|uniref:Uncharacterized protein n=1 Tax=Oleoguttula mirabilis TaxID=1507867 RepID=A0AAV9JCD5_9PEZI|nr:hypothetical protein LTR36_006073 [Oleoguttula mirabilis]